MENTNIENTPEIISTYPEPINPLENSAKRHPFLAGIADVYFAFLAGGAFLALLVALFKATVFDSITVALITGALFYIVFISAAVVYYRKYSEKTTFLTFGERICGRRVVDGRKEWFNPYGVKRTALFFIIFITLFLYGNHWDSLFDGKIFTLLQVVGGVIRIAIIFWALLLFGKGNLLGIVPLALITIFDAVLAIAFLPPDLGAVSLRFNGMILVIYMFLLILFYLKVQKSLENVKEESE